MSNSLHRRVLTDDHTGIAASKGERVAHDITSCVRASPLSHVIQVTFRIFFLIVYGGWYFLIAQRQKAAYQLQSSTGRNRMADGGLVAYDGNLVGMRRE